MRVFSARLHFCILCFAVGVVGVVVDDVPPRSNTRLTRGS